MMNRAPIYRYLRIGLVAFVWGLLIQPCFAGKVKALLQPDADFAHYKTYQWLPPQVLTKTGVVEDHPVFGPLVKDAVNRELARQGLKEVTEGGDLQVATTILTGAISQRPGYMLEGGSNAAA